MGRGVAQGSGVARGWGAAGHCLIDGERYTGSTLEIGLGGTRDQRGPRSGDGSAGVTRVATRGAGNRGDGADILNGNLSRGSSDKALLIGRPSNSIRVVYQYQERQPRPLDPLSDTLTGVDVEEDRYTPL